MINRRVLGYLALVALSACSLKDPNQSTLHIQMPAGAAPQTNRAQANFSRERDQVPNQLSDFTCFAVNVTGPSIQNNPRPFCPKSTDFGIIAGTVPVSGGSIDVQVPVGSGVNVQVIGFVSPTGICFDMNQFLNTPSGSGGGPHTSQPYEIGSAAVDVTGDSPVTIVAAYVKGTSQALYQDCGNQNNLPIAEGITAGSQFTSTFLQDDSFESSATNVTSFSLASPVPIGAADLSALPSTYNTDGNSPLPSPSPIVSSQVFGYNGPGTLPSQRALVQLAWDVTALQPTAHVNLNLIMRGGSTCAPITSPSNVPRNDASTSAVAGIRHVGTVNYWIPVGVSDSLQGNGDCPAGWGCSGGGISENAPLADIVVTRADGKRFVSVAIESEYASSDQTCGSFVDVALANLQVVNLSDADGAGNNGQLNLQPWFFPDTQANYDGTSVAVVEGKSLFFNVNGGSLPYVSITSSLQNIDPVTGLYSTSIGQVGHTDTVTVVDDTGTSTSINVDIVATLPNGSNPSPSAVPSNIPVVALSAKTTYLTSGAFEVGSCAPIGVALSNTSASVSVILAGIYGSFYTDAGCNNPVNGPNPFTVPGGSTGTVYYKAFAAGPETIGLAPGSGLNLTAALAFGVINPVASQFMVMPSPIPGIPGVVSPDPTQVGEQDLHLVAQNCYQLNLLTVSAMLNPAHVASNMNLDAYLSYSTAGGVTPTFYNSSNTLTSGQSPCSSPNMIPSSYFATDDSPNGIGLGLGITTGTSALLGITSTGYSTIYMSVNGSTTPPVNQIILSIHGDTGSNFSTTDTETFNIVTP